MIGKCPSHDDKHRSFSYKEEGGKLLLKCFAGTCSFEQLLAALEAKGVVLPPLSEECQDDRIDVWFSHPLVGDFCAKFESSDIALVAIYPYHDEAGKLVGFKGRFKPKTFRSFTHYSLHKNYATRKQVLPYRLPQVLAALTEGCPIHIFEGEKDVENALTMGLEECTSFGCATDPLPHDYWSRFRGGCAVVWADNDAPGLRRADEVALYLSRNGCKVKVVITPTGKDFSDWKDAGATMDDIAKLVTTAPLWLPPAEQIEEMAEKGAFPKTKYDMGTEAFAGEYFAHKYGRMFRFAFDQKLWLYHDKVWEKDAAGEHHEKTKQLAISLKEDLRQISSPLAKEALGKLAHKIQSDAGRRAVISSAKTIKSLRVDLSKMDGKDTAHLLSCENGVINLRTGVLTEHAPEYMITKHVSRDVDMSEDPTMFIRLVHSMFHDEKVADWLLHFFGYCLTGENWFQRFIMLIGLAGSGKSQLTAILRGVMGDHVGDVAPQSMIETRQRTAGAESDLAGTRGCRVVLVAEAKSNESYKLDSQILKSMTGEDWLSVKFMGQDKFQLQARAKVLFTGNAPPPIEVDDGLERRLTHVKFERMPDRHIDSLAEKVLAAEAPKILGFLAKRAKAVYEKPELLHIPATVDRWSRNYIEEFDYVKQWADARVKAVTGHFVAKRELLADFEKWCRENYVSMDVTQNSLTRRLLKLGYRQASQDGVGGWKDIALRIA